MSTARAYLGALLVVLFVALAVALPAPAAAQPAPTPLAVGEREVLVSLPADHDPTRTYPVILAFGGWGVTPEVMAADSGLQDAADAIVVHGRGLADAWAGAPYAVTTIEADIDFARHAVEEVAARYPVDRSRIYAVGHSNGGAFAVALGCRAPDLVAGVVSVSGMFYTGIDTAEDCIGAPVPVMLIHALNDDVARPEGGVRHGAPFDPAAAVLERWAWRNTCLPVADARPTPLPAAIHHARLGCQAETEYLVSATAGHAWPAYAATTAWDFLSRQNR